MKTFQITWVLFIFLLLRSTLVNAAPAGAVIFWGYAADAYVPHKAPSASIGVVTIGSHALTNAVALAAGYMHSLALRNDGTVVGWGLDNRGQAIGVATVTPDRANGVVKIDGHILSDAMAIAAGSHFSLALKSDGTVVGWGDTQYGQATVPAGLSNVVAIAAGGANSLALKQDGTIIGWGDINVPSGLSNVVSIATSGAWGGGNEPGVGMVLKNDGAVVGWNARDGQIIRETGMINIATMAASELHGLAVKRDGTVVGWGRDAVFGESIIPEGLSNIVAVAAGNRHSLALRNDGTVITWGYNHRHALDVPVGLSNVVAIAAGQDFSLAITTNRAVAEKFMQKR